MSQPPPTPNSRPHIADLVIADIIKRKAAGVAQYGVALQPHNGRDALQDAYEEALDKAKYLKQAIVERGPAAGILFRRATHDREGVYRREHCESVKADASKIAVDPTHWMDSSAGMSFAEIARDMQTDEVNWPVPPGEAEIAVGLVRLIELGLVEVVGPGCRK